MRIETENQSDGFLLILAEGGDRCRYVTWEATNQFGMSDSGKIDISILNKKQAFLIKTGWEPNDVKCNPVRDSTPGMSQPFVCYIPLGVSILEFTAETGIKSKIDILVSPSGDSHDTRSMGSLPMAPPGGKVELRIIMQLPWSKIVIKKADKEKVRICLSRFSLKTAAGEIFEPMAHLIKAEHSELRKEGKDGILFLPEAIQYSYFAMGLQRR